MEIRPTIKAYIPDDDSGDPYACPGGLAWSSAEDMLLCSDAFLGLCGCGADTDLDYIIGGMELLDERGPDEIGAWDEWWEAKCARETAHFGNEASAQFFYKWADSIGLSDHGVGVPGWLTDEGRGFLALLREARDEMMSV